MCSFFSDWKRWNKQKRRKKRESADRNLGKAKWKRAKKTHWWKVAEFILFRWSRNNCNILPPVPLQTIVLILEFALPVGRSVGFPKRISINDKRIRRTRGWEHQQTLGFSSPDEASLSSPLPCPHSPAFLASFSSSPSLSSSFFNLFLLLLFLSLFFIPPLSLLSHGGKYRRMHEGETETWINLCLYFSVRFIINQNH